ncbi:MAG TPA: endonuclease III [Gemmatimonadaceae bacterium]|nr:endonuclease III [Gemmatimonadaceae bacterium]
MTARRPSERARRTAKKAFDIPRMLRLIEAAVRPYPKAALFELAARGHASVFEQLVACIISIRTRDEVMLPTVLALFEAAPDPAEVAKLGPDRIDALIHDSAFHEPKSRQIHAIAESAVRDHGGTLPCDESVLRSFSGVGPKCANLVLGIACGRPALGVDVHVHRVTNRWGIVSTKTPERTMAALETLVSPRYFLDLNRLLVPFGKHICTGRLPCCSTCPVLDYCRQVGVGRHR